MRVAWFSDIDSMWHRWLRVLMIGGILVAEGVGPALADDLPSGHMSDIAASSKHGNTVKVDVCRASQGDGVHEQQASSDVRRFEGLQIETSDIHPYEMFFESILQARPLFRIDHPQVDHIRGYCYRDIQIVVRQDLGTPRPTGWVQVNFVVADVSSVKEELERALERSSVQAEELVRIRLKPDVPRSNCRVMRLEVTGPEGFMVGFNQFKEGTCKPHEHKPEDGK